jgi:hypothetical protein
LEAEGPPLEVDDETRRGHALDGTRTSVAPGTSALTTATCARMAPADARRGARATVAIGMVDELLPSARFHGDDPRPVGFLLELPDSHVVASGAVLEEVAAAVTPSHGGKSDLRVCLSSARYIPGTPFQLYSYHLVGFDDQGRVRDAVDAGEEVQYAFVINQPIEVQREAALWFLYELVFRQLALRAPEAVANQADLIAAQASDHARAEFRFRILSGWREAARSLAARATHDGLGLHVRYQRDPFPDRSSIVRRMPALRATYNSIELAHQFIDKMVSLVGGRDPRVVVGPGSNDVRTLLERRLLDMGLRHMVAQTTRDALVLGNGYLVMPASANEGPFNLRPEAVKVTDDGDFVVLGNDGRESERLGAHVLHIKGVEQFDSPYGFSVLEVVVSEWSTRQTMDDVLSRTEALLARSKPTPEQAAYLKEVEALVSRHRDASDERLGRLLWYPRDWVPDAVDGLYLPGQEQM